MFAPVAGLKTGEVLASAACVACPSIQWPMWLMAALPAVRMLVLMAVIAG
jgi:hypothetical protein